jgi:hypothetical protein
LVSLADHTADTGNAHQQLTVGLGLADRLDLFGNGLPIVVIVLLALQKWLYVDRRNDPGLDTQLSARSG